MCITRRGAEIKKRMVVQKPVGVRIARPSEQGGILHNPTVKHKPNGDAQPP